MLKHNKRRIHSHNCLQSGERVKRIGNSHHPTESHSNHTSLPLKERHLQTGLHSYLGYHEVEDAQTFRFSYRVYLRKRVDSYKGVCLCVFISFVSPSQGQVQVMCVQKGGISMRSVKESSKKTHRPVKRFTRS